MAPLFRMPNSILCFFCNAPAKPSPQNPRQFRCPNCGCWNRFDAAGEIISDEPAMHDESLNRRSFARRASPSKVQLPTMYGKGPFCHNCQTNQMLLVNLLGNYLPPPESPEYPRRLATLPEYKESLHLRYPPVCNECLPLVEEELRQKNEMARTKALGGWLQDSKGEHKQRRVSAARKELKTVKMELVTWKLRGSLWVASLVVALLGNSTALFLRPLPCRLAILQPGLPVLVLLSLLWTTWDPTYASARRAKLQGRGLRVKGGDTYVKLQVLVWLLRFLTSILLAVSWRWPQLDFLQLSHHPIPLRSRYYFFFSIILEVLCLGLSLSVLRVQRPASVRLIDTTTHLHPSRATTPAQDASPSTTPVPSAPDLLSSLSLSSKPVLASRAPNPIFGLPSLLTSYSSTAGPSSTDNKTDACGIRDADAMDVDWPTPDPKKSKKTKKTKRRLAGGARRASDDDDGDDNDNDNDDDGGWLRPQRFFAPEKPTGLEGLFAKTNLAEESDMRRRGGQLLAGNLPLRWNWLWVYVVSLVPLLGIACAVWGWSSRERGA